METWSYLLAAIFSLIKENHMMTNAQHNTQQLLADLQIWLEVTFSLTPEQKANVHIMAGDAIFDPSCITFMMMHFDVEAKVQGSMKELKFSNIYGNPACEKILLGYIKCQCSSVHNTFWDVICNGKCTLSNFIFESASRFKLGGPTYGLGPAYKACLAILHCFSYENPELLDHEEEMDEEPAQFNEDDATWTSSTEPPRKKQKCGGHGPKGEDFWSQVEK
ncbi:hypothetical protein J3A83DRAFT_4374575 [Scleroderma citrinum]